MDDSISYNLKVLLSENETTRHATTRGLNAD